jgi:putative transposase
MSTAGELAAEVGTVAACRSLGLARASFYRQRRPRPPQAPPAPRASHRALRPEERQAVLEVLHDERFVDHAPAEVYASLLDGGTYLCSVRTMYRILAQHDEVRERRDLLRHPNYRKPQLLATAPDQVWSWDITKLLGPAKWTYYHLYVVLDIFSRYVVGWLVAERESSALAQRLVHESACKEGIAPGQLVLHSDRGASMKSHGLSVLLANLGITKTHSRPHVSNDNPFSEAQFKTLKYRPDFPARFGSLEDARAFCRRFFHWYNLDHHHSALGWLTPQVVHHGLAAPIRQQRAVVLDGAYATHPERFVRGKPTPPVLPSAAWINPPAKSQVDPGDTTVLRCEVTS